jgi:hypothetical protein
MDSSTPTRKRTIAAAIVVTALGSPPSSGPARILRSPARNRLCARGARPRRIVVNAPILRAFDGREEEERSVAQPAARVFRGLGTVLLEGAIEAYSALRAEGP